MMRNPQPPAAMMLIHSRDRPLFKKVRFLVRAYSQLAQTVKNEPQITIGGM